MALTGQQYVLTVGEAEVTVVEIGAGLRGYRVGDTPVTEHYDADELPPRGCGAVLVPWPNRLRDGRYSTAGRTFQLPINDQETHTANHGLARWVRWTPVEQSDSAIRLALDLPPQSGWEFELHLEVHYVLDDDGLTVTASARNTGAGSAPFGAGFHPYFSLRGTALADAVVTLPADRHLVMDAQQVPTGTENVTGTDLDLRAGRALGSTRLDDGFTDLTGNEASVRTSAGGATVWWDEQFNHLQVFTPDNWAHDRPAIAIEPMTCAPDAFNNGAGLHHLEPGTSWTGTWGIRPL